VLANLSRNMAIDLDPMPCLRMTTQDKKIIIVGAGTMNSSNGFSMLTHGPGVFGLSTALHLAKAGECLRSIAKR